MQVDFWHWLILGFVLIALEVLMPGTFLLWPGIAALLTGILAYMAPGLGWEGHALAFAVLTVAAAFAGRRLYDRLRHPVADEPNLNRRAAQYVGTVHTLSADIVDGTARMKVGDSTWKVTGPDLPAGTRVRVVAVDGIALRVEKAE
ncbi:MAG TPA: NfeD family protein [Candidatus Omnitrophota bacterium]|nr:NfeD family protein [Candidatus Omnitrophota bacterium]